MTITREMIFSKLPVLETERTILRKLQFKDAEDMFRYGSNEEVSKYTTWPTHQSLEDTRRFIEAVMNAYEEHKIAPWGIEDKQTKLMIGTVGFVSWNVVHARAEIGYALSRDFWNLGYMTEIMKRIVEFGFNEMKLVRMEARCHPDNIGSARVMEKSGMQFEGTLRKHIYTKGEYQDAKMYAIINEALY
ncbi:GNAT family N-acetyltransferase [Paenibacillus sp. RC67]|uniref:GNAT family N-acetyltransferase n=1 Tax=Paenibacillus sp. RC67 TaxID=3039392 RepID=UPI0024AE26C5|nr:GNAT family N-acetyltransferase [Paenibacillus sp. RC67]